ncbi:MAG: helix-turn-helix domain-containing protein [Clostridia bacterium]|nr:helix-turn-helix domain-containing protein [Clostridia bacterium]
MADKKITVKRRHGFTMVPNSAFDGSLPLSAIGLYAFMLSRPDDWEFSVSGMAKCLGVGRDAVRSALVKLEEAGFLIREQSHNEKGLFSGNTYVLYDEKIDPLSENPTTVAPLPENPTVNAPLSGKPLTDKPSTENPTEYNNIYTQEGSNTPPIVPLKTQRKRKDARSAPEWKPERFAGLWDFYPKEGRKDKQRAMRAWDKLKPDDALIRRIGRALKVQMRSEMWQKGVGIPYLATYLNGRRWEDVSLEDLTPRAEAPSGWSTDAEVVASW